MMLSVRGCFLSCGLYYSRTSFILLSLSLFCHQWTQCSMAHYHIVSIFLLTHCIILSIMPLGYSIDRPTWHGTLNTDRDDDEDDHCHYFESERRSRWEQVGTIGNWESWSSRSVHRGFTRSRKSEHRWVLFSFNLHPQLSQFYLICVLVSFQHTTHAVNSRRRGITRPPPPTQPAPTKSSTPTIQTTLVQQCQSLHNSSGFLYSAADTRPVAAHGSTGEQRMDPFKLVERDLDNLYITIRQELSTTKMTELRDVASYYFDGQGKALRPLIVILIARAMNAHLRGDSELLNPQKNVSLIIEMIHTASLIHDDVIDSADTRRGKPSVNILWGMKKSIIAGDFVISRGSQMLARLNDAWVISTLSEVRKEIIEFETINSLHPITS